MTKITKETHKWLKFWGYWSKVSLNWEHPSFPKLWIVSLRLGKLPNLSCKPTADGKSKWSINSGFCFSPFSSLQVIAVSVPISQWIFRIRWITFDRGHLDSQNKDIPCEALTNWGRRKNTFPGRAWAKGQWARKCSTSLTNRMTQLPD